MKDEIRNKIIEKENTSRNKNTNENKRT